MFPLNLFLSTRSIFVLDNIQINLAWTTSSCLGIFYYHHGTLHHGLVILTLFFHSSLFWSAYLLSYFSCSNHPPAQNIWHSYYLYHKLNPWSNKSHITLVKQPFSWHSSSHNHNKTGVQMHFIARNKPHHTMLFRTMQCGLKRNSYNNQVD